MPSKEEYLDNLLKGLIDEHDQILDEDFSDSGETVIEDKLTVPEKPAMEDIVIDEKPAMEDIVIDEEPAMGDIVIDEEPAITGDYADDGQPVDVGFFDADNISELAAQEIPVSADELSDKDLNEKLEDVMSDLSDDFSDSEDMSALESEEGSDEADFDIGNLDSVLNNASEEDIEKILNNNREDSGSRTEENSEDLLNEEIESMFDISADNEDSDEINDMLQKSDNDEAVDQDVLALLQSIPDDEVDSLGGEENQGETYAEIKARREEEKRLKREEKKEAKRLAKEARQAKKEAKRAARGRKKAVEESEFSDAQEILPDDSNDDVSAEMDEFLSGALNDAEQTPQGTDVSELDLSEAGIGDLFVRTVDDIGEHDAETLVDGVFSLEDAVDGIREENKKKKGFFAKILDFLTEEDEENEEEESGEIILSEENQNIINELDNESGSGKKGKKGKKAKKDKKGNKDKKGKKDKKGEDSDQAEGTDGEEASQNEDEKKGRKAKKAKKPKNESNSDSDEQKPAKKLSTKRIVLIALICLSILAVIILSTNFASDYSVKKAGRQAFSEGDYQTCYQNLYGKDLSESEQVMFSKSECILRVRLWIREYEMFADEGSEVEALDSLIQSVNDYPALYEYAAQWNSVGEVSEVYMQMLDILSNKYGLTEEQAKEIAAEPDDVEYTRKVTAVAEGKSYSATDSSKEVTDSNEPLKDKLPEEEGMVNANFVDNM